jgi:hypothetical protein
MSKTACEDTCTFVATSEIVFIMVRDSPSPQAQQLPVVQGLLIEA